MKADCYQAKKSPQPGEMIFVLVPHGKGVDALPGELKQAAGGFTFDKTVEINPADKMACFDVDAAGKNLAESGYHLISMKR